MATAQAIATRDVGGNCSMCSLHAPKGGRAAEGGGRVHVLTAQMASRDGVYFARACAFDDGDDGCFDALRKEQQFVDGKARAAITLARGLLGDDDDGIANVLSDLRL